MGPQWVAYFATDATTGNRKGDPCDYTPDESISEVLYAQGLCENHGPTYDGICQINP